MSDIEQRLRSALTARADLVRPEDLSPFQDPPAEEPRRWWQHPGSYLIAAAVAVIVLALPLLVIAATDDGREADPADGPSPTTTEVSDPDRQVAAELYGDVDGDGEDETVAATHTSGDAPAWTIEVELSSTGATVSYYIGEVDGVALTRAADVDGRTGDEILIVVEPGDQDPHSGAPTVLGLRDGELVPIVAYAFDDPAVDGVATYWWLRNGELWWWRSEGPVAGDEDGAYAVEVVRFRHGETLTPEVRGEYCVTSSAPIRLRDCGDAGVSTGSDDTADAAWWEQHPEGLPDSWSDALGVAPGTWLEGDVDGDGATDQVRTTGSEGNVSLQVELADGGSLTTPLAGPSAVLEPLVTLDGSEQAAVPVAESEGAAGTTYTTWHLYLVRDGELVEATVPGTPTFGSQTTNLSEEEGGTDSWRTWVDPSGVLVTMSYDDQGTAIDDPAYPGTAAKVYRNTFFGWSLDDTTLVASELGQGCTVRADTAVTACP